MAGENRDETLMRYLSGDLTFEEWNELRKRGSQSEQVPETRDGIEGQGHEGEAMSLTARLTDLTVVSSENGTTVLTTTPGSEATTSTTNASTTIFPPELAGGQVLMDASGNAILVKSSATDQGQVDLTRSQVQLSEISMEQGLQEGSEAEISITGVSQSVMPVPVELVKIELPDSPPNPKAGGKVSDAESDDVVIIDSETTMRYLTGEMPFEEYSALLEQCIKEEPEEEPQIDTIGLSMELTEGNEVLVAPSTSDAAALQPDEEKKAKKKVKRPHAHLPKHLQGLMGEANMKFAHGEHEEAIKMCMEVIRLAPTAPEPFQTLGMLYEDSGDNEKALQFSLIAAHLNPSDSEEWVRLAEMSLEADNVRQAISCYDKAIKYDGTNLTLLFARCDLHEQTGDVSRALAGYQQILKLLPREDAQKYFQLARDMTKSYHSMGMMDKAMVTMEEALQLHPSHVTAEDVNLLLELYMTSNEHHKPIQVLVDHCGLRLVKLDATNLEPSLLCDTTQPDKVVLPEEFPIDLKVKLIVCLIRLQQTKCLQPLVAPLLLENPDEVGDLYLDIAEAYMERGDYKDARQFLVALVHSENYNLAAVWLRFGECLNALGELQPAADAYGKVVELAPSHMEARVSLSALKQQLGRHEEALQVLSQGTATEGETRVTLDLRLLLPRCLLLYTQARYDEFIECSKQVLFGPFKDTFDKPHLAVILSNRSLKHRIVALRNVIGPSLDHSIKEASSLLQEPSVTVEDLWELYLKMCQSLIDMERLDEFQEVSIIALMSPHFMNDPARALETDFICLTACLINKTSHFAYNFIREICVKQLDNNRAWNLFCQVITMSQDIRHNRFCLRLMIKHPDHLALGILNAHNAMVAGTYKHALGEYVCAFQKDPHNPLLSLCIGITFIHMACQKFASSRHSLTIQGCAFLNQYLELRGECQEAYYNVGRAMHQLGLLHAAVFYYEKALSFDCAVPGTPEVFDLSREAAFNLALIYQASNSHQMAGHITQKYLQI